MAKVLQSTRVKVTDSSKVENILATYAWMGFEVNFDKVAGTLELVDGQDGDARPHAIKVNLIPDDEDSPDQMSSVQVFNQLMVKQGDEGFVDLLEELAPCLESSLLVLTLEKEESLILSRAWVVQQDGGKALSLSATL